MPGEVTLGHLLGGLTGQIVDAQAKLDAAARGGVEHTVLSPDGELDVPPLWFQFQSVVIDLELTARVERGLDRTSLLCRTEAPESAGLFARAESSRSRIRVEISPRRTDGLQE